MSRSEALALLKVAAKHCRTYAMGENAIGAVEVMRVLGAGFRDAAWRESMAVAAAASATKRAYASLKDPDAIASRQLFTRRLLAAVYGPGSGKKRLGPLAPRLHDIRPQANIAATHAAARLLQSPLHQGASNSSRESLPAAGYVPVERPVDDPWPVRCCYTCFAAVRFVHYISLTLLAPRNPPSTQGTAGGLLAYLSTEVSRDPVDDITRELVQKVPPGVPGGLRDLHVTAAVVTARGARTSLFASIVATAPLSRRKMDFVVRPLSVRLAEALGLKKFDFVPPFKDLRAVIVRFREEHMAEYTSGSFLITVCVGRHFQPKIALVCARTYVC